MSKFTTRDIHQRRISQTIQLLDAPLTYLKDFIEVYEPQHPELSERAEKFAEILIMLQDALKQFKTTF
jgi:hypothetical protein